MGLAAFTGIAVVAASALLLQLPFGVEAGVASGANAAPAPAPPAAPGQKVASSYQLRCWQYGRLLFDEGPVTLPAEARQGARLVAFDRHGSALIVTESGGTTCLARPAPAPRSLALPN
jgi:hypothetical protein